MRLRSILFILALSLTFQTQVFSETGKSINPSEPHDAYFMALMSYKNNINLRIAKSWKTQVPPYRGSLKPGSVAFRYFVNSNGQVSDIKIESGKEHELIQVLGIRSINSINQNPVVFPEDVKAKLEGGFYHRIAFQVGR